MCVHMNNKLQRTDKSIAQVQQLSEPAQKAQVLWRTLATPKDFRQPNAIAPYNKENTHNKYRYNKYNKCRCKQQSNHIISYHIISLQKHKYVCVYQYILYVLPTSCLLYFAPYNLLYFAASSWIMMINSCVNPLICALFWFRRSSKLIITLRILHSHSNEIKII